MKKISIVIFLLLLCEYMMCQIPQFDRQEAIDRIYDFLSEDEAIVDYDAIYQTLIDLSENPIELNSATPQELKQLIFLSDQQIENYCYYLYRSGGLKTIYELQLIEGLDLFTIALMLPFVILTPIETEQSDSTSSFRYLWQHATHRLDMRLQTTLEPERGYQLGSEGYLGIPYDILLRYRFNLKQKFWLNISAEQDAGEPLWGTQHRGFESYHLSMQYQGRKWLKRIVVGDYRAGFGQGLIMGSAFRIGKTGEILPSARSETGIRRLSSLTEYEFLRGIGGLLQFGNIELSLLYAIQQMDADTAGGTFSTFKTDGYFRTTQDFEKRHTVWRQVGGIHLQAQWQTFSIGTTLYGALLNIPMTPQQKPYTQYYFTGKQQAAVGLNHRWRRRMWQWWGEIGVTHKGAIATQQAIEISPISRLTLTLLYRYYAPNYDLFLAKGFSESGNIRNETGFYFAMRLLPLPGWRLTGYADIFRFPAIRYGTDGPTAGYDLFLQNDWIVTENMILQARVRYRNNEAYQDNQTNVHYLQDVQRCNIRLDLIFTEHFWHTRSYVQMNLTKGYEASQNYGWLVMQEASIKVPHWGLSFNARFELFDAEDYMNRFYLLERNVPTLYYSPFLYGKGARYYLLLQYKYGSIVTIAARIAQTYYADGRKSISSGLSEITGNHSTDISIYLLWQIKHHSRRNP